MAARVASTRVAWTAPGVLAGTLIACATAAPGPSAGPAVGPAVAQGWALIGNSADAYRMRDTLPAALAFGPGSAVTLQRAGADPVLRFQYGSTGVTVPADAFRGRRVRFSAELRTTAPAAPAAGTAPVLPDAGASLWGHVDGPGGAILVLEGGNAQRRRGTSDWAPAVMTLDVPAEAERLVLGTILVGSGTVAARHVRIIPVDLPPATAATSPEARAVLDSAITLARAHSLWRDTVTWNVVAPDLRRFLAGAQQVSDAYPLVARLLMRLGDQHSFFMPPPPPPPAPAPGAPGAGAATPGAGGAGTASPAEEDAEPRWFAAERVGYLRVPGHGGADRDASRTYVTRARAALEAQRARGACGWIVDVRTNSGGNMWPMLAALRPLLGGGALGAFRGPDSTQTWGARAPWDTTDVYARGLPAAPDLTAAPVAVLTGGRTASSGEAVTTAFRGRPSTRSFGTPTRGVSTANQAYALPGGGVVVLTTAVYVDRTGHAYGAAIEPDERVAPAAAGDTARDPARAAALGWLRQQRACARP